MENAEPTRALNTVNAETASAPPEPTQALPASPTVSADALLSDAERRNKLESELARMGMTAAEVRRLLEANATSTDPKERDAPTAPASAVARPSTGKAGRVTSASLQSFAADLTASATAAQVAAIEKAGENLPEFRESTAQEMRQAETLLRETNLLRRREKYRDAEAKCREALALVPKDAAALELLGDLLQGVGRIDEALAAYKRAVEADAKRGSAERKYGDLLMRQKNWGNYDPEAVPKNPWISVLLSGLLPGAGQIYNGQLIKGLLVMTGAAACIYGWTLFGAGAAPAPNTPKAHVGHASTKTPVNLGAMVPLVLGGVLYIYAVADANMVAQRNRRAPSGGSSGWNV